MSLGYSIERISSSKDVTALASLLSQSAGYETSIADEVEYFESTNPRNWWMALQGGIPVAFIRDLDHSGSTPWGVLEFFTVSENKSFRRSITKDLLSKFLTGSNFAAGYRLRFETLPSNQAVIDVFQEQGFTDRIETFLHYENTLNSLTCNDLDAEKAAEKDVPEIVTAIENLHSVNEKEDQIWLSKIF